MKNSELLIVNLIESKVDQANKINYQLLPLISEFEKLSTPEKNMTKTLFKKQADSYLAIANLLKTLKQ